MEIALQASSELNSIFAGIREIYWSPGVKSSIVDMKVYGSAPTIRIEDSL